MDPPAGIRPSSSIIALRMAKSGLGSGESPGWTNSARWGRLLPYTTSCPQPREASMSETFNLDQVAGELNSQKSSGSDDASGTERLDRWLASLIHRYGSDLL